MSYGTQEKFIKELNGVSAPAGFHYMPNGKLMSDADHVALYGYALKNIKKFNIDLHDIPAPGEQRPFSIIGSKGAYFSMQIFDSSATPKYYNFYTKSWSTTKSGLNKIELETGRYSNTISFPAVSSLTNYTIMVIAETVENCKTGHAGLVEFRNPDNSININKSTGSNSNILKKILYQDAAKTFTLSCIAPVYYSTVTNTVDGAVSSSNRVVMDSRISDLNIVPGDLITGTGVAASTHQLVSKIDPDRDNNKEFEMRFAQNISDGVTLTFTGAYHGMTPHETNSTVGAWTSRFSTGSSFSTFFSISIKAPSGRLFSIKRKPTINDLCAYVTPTIGSAGQILPGEDTGGSTQFFRWPVDNIAGLKEGMIFESNRSRNAKKPNNFITSYETTQTTQELVRDGYNDIIYDKTITDEFFPGVDDKGADPTTVDRNGNVTAQSGSLIFNAQQIISVANSTTHRIFAYGQSNIASLPATAGMRVSLSDIELETTPQVVTVDGAVSNSTTVTLASTNDGLGQIAAGAEISGANIAASAANPTVVSKAVNTGAGNMVLSAAQTLEDGQTLTVNNMFQTVTLTGNITVENFPIANTTLYFDVERFLESI